MTTDKAIEIATFLFAIIITLLFMAFCVVTMIWPETIQKFFEFIGGGSGLIYSEKF